MLNKLLILTLVGIATIAIAHPGIITTAQTNNGVGSTEKFISTGITKIIVAVNRML
jgi:hypothetical protein